MPLGGYKRPMTFALKLIHHLAFTMGRSTARQQKKKNKTSASTPPSSPSSLRKPMDDVFADEEDILPFIPSSINPVSIMLLCLWIWIWNLKSMCQLFVPMLHCFSSFISLLQLPCATFNSKNKRSPAVAYAAVLQLLLAAIQCWMMWLTPTRRTFLSCLLPTTPSRARTRGLLLSLTSFCQQSRAGWCGLRRWGFLPFISLLQPAEDG